MRPRPGDAMRGHDHTQDPANSRIARRHALVQFDTGTAMHGTSSRHHAIRNSKMPA